MAVAGNIKNLLINQVSKIRVQRVHDNILVLTMYITDIDILIAILYEITITIDT